MTTETNKGAISRRDALKLAGAGLGAMFTDLFLPKFFKEALASPEIISSRFTDIVYIELPEGYKNGISKIEVHLPNPQIGQGGVIRMGGDLNFDSGSPLAAFAEGSKSPDNVTEIIGYVSGDKTDNLQRDVCDAAAGNPSLNREPLNDMVERFGVPVWAIQPGVEIKAYVNDEGNTGEPFVINYEMLVEASKVHTEKTLVVMLPPGMDNMISNLKFKLADVWNGMVNKDAGNIRVRYMGWKGKQATGFAIPNAQEGQQSAQVPACVKPGPELNNDLHKPMLFIDWDQAKQDGQYIEVQEKDEANPGRVLRIYPNGVVKMVYLPLVASQHVNKGR